MSQGRVDHFGIAVLGVLTICSYGSWYYSFGVLLDPIRLDTGWSESTLAASFSAGTVLVGLAALKGGQMLDRVGHRPVFVVAAIVGSAGLITASVADTVALFFAGSAIGLAAFGALGFYHVTMTTAVRLNPEAPGRAIALLTIWGALASAIFLPGTNWLESQFGWRITTRILAVITSTAFALAALALKPTSPSGVTRHSSISQVLASTVADPPRRLFTLAVASGGLALSTILVYQVPVMTAAGLGAAAAASIAGLRGFCQLGGRLPLTPIVRALGSDRALSLSFAAITIGGVLLAFSGSVPVAVGFAVIAGFGIGAFSPLQGMKAEELFDRDQLGATMGVYGAVLLIAGSSGPVIAGVLSTQTGERRWASVLIIVAGVAGLIATLLMARHRPNVDDVAQPTEPASQLSK